MEHFVDTLQSSLYGSLQSKFLTWMKQFCFGKECQHEHTLHWEEKMVPSFKTSVTLLWGRGAAAAKGGGNAEGDG